MAGAVLLGCVHSSGRMEVSQRRPLIRLAMVFAGPRGDGVEMFFSIPSVIVNGHCFKIASGFRLPVGGGDRKTWNSTRT